MVLGMVPFDWAPSITSFKFSKKNRTTNGAYTDSVGKLLPDAIVEPAALRDMDDFDDVEAALQSMPVRVPKQAWRQPWSPLGRCESCGEVRPFARICEGESLRMCLECVTSGVSVAARAGCREQLARPQSVPSRGKPVLTEGERPASSPSFLRRPAKPSQLQARRRTSIVAETERMLCGLHDLETRAASVFSWKDGPGYVKRPGSGARQPSVDADRPWNDGPGRPGNTTRQLGGNAWARCVDR